MRRTLLLSTAAFVGTLAVGVAFAAGGLCSANAQDATWLANPGSGDYNTDANWNPATVPTGTAFFGISNTTSLTFLEDSITAVGGWTFNNPASDYEFTLQLDAELTFNGAGIAVNGGSAEITTTFRSFLVFENGATAGSATIVNDRGNTDFNDNSSAANANINILSGDTEFNDDSTAANAAFSVNFGALRFNDNSTAANATITHTNGEVTFDDNSTAANATINNSDRLLFRGGSNAGSATISNNGGFVQFSDTSSANSATINNNFGFVQFLGASTAGSATINNDSASNNAVQFSGTSTAGNATITTNAGAETDFSGSTGPLNDRRLTAGSLAGDGSYFLGANELTVGGNNLSTEVGGVISDCGPTGTDCLIEGATGGSLVKTGTGTFTLSGANIYTGPTIVEEGTLDLQNGAAIEDSGAVTVAGGADLSVTSSETIGSLAGAGNTGLAAGQTLTTGGNNSSTTVSGIISGDGGLTKAGTGIFTLSGANTYTGPTTVNEGSLLVNGSIVSDVTVNGGTLGGTGSVGATTVNSGATIAPGNSIGTMIVNGAFNLNPGAVYEVEINAAGQSDKVVVNGTVNLTGSVLNVMAADGDYAPETRYTIIENDGNDAVEGEFAEVNTNLVFLTPTVDYDAGDGNDVVLTVVRTATLFPDVARTKNQKAVASALEMFPDDNPLFLAVLNQTEAGARQAFDALSGEVHATVAGTLADDSRYTREAVLGRLMQATHDDALGANGPQVAAFDGKSLVAVEPERAPLAFWTAGFGAWGDYGSDGNAASASRDLGGFLSGIDADIGGGWRAGLATGASFSSVDVNARASSADVETYHLGGYAGGMLGGFALRGGGLYAWNSIDTSRAVIFPGFFERQNASYDADTGQLFGEVAYPMQTGNVALEPFGGIAFVSVDADSFRERGGAQASLRGVDTDQDVGYTTLGLRAATTMQWGATTVTPHFAAAWQHAFDDVTPGARFAFATTGIGFAIDGVPLAEDSALIDAGLDFALGANGTASVSYSGQFGDGFTDNAVKGRATWLF